MPLWCWAVDSDMDGLVERAFSVRATALRNVSEVVVDPAVPILYFGDLAGYRRSPIRVVTVGLNPSRGEFPAEDPWVRFPGAVLGGARYRAALDRYFQTAPYGSWFGTFEPILEGLGVSFYPGADGVALHTDLCSPVATDPTWSGLDLLVQEQLAADGIPLWHDLIRVLAPDVVLVSVARRWLDRIAFSGVGVPREVFRVDRATPYVVEGWRIEVAPGAEPVVVFGKAAQRPFGTISNIDKRRLGATLATLVRDGRR